MTQSQERQQRPPEYGRLRQAMRIQDLNERISSLQKLLKDFPQTQYKRTIESAIFHARIGLSDSLSEILKLQKGLLDGQEGMGKVGMAYALSREIMYHDNLGRFDPGRVTDAVKEYVDLGLELLNDQELVASLPERQRSIVDFYRPNLQLLLAQAYLNNGRLKDTRNTLKSYIDQGGAANKSYQYTLAQFYESEGNTQQAFDGYFEAAVENFEDSVAKARQMYRKLHGSLEGFDTKLEAKWRELPFHPKPFKPKDTWQGKVVLAELFTGAQCPPCVAADLGFDGLIEAFDPRHVAVLVYHLHVPGPDALTNHASSARAAFYGVRSTPSTLFDGVSQHGGGGDRSRGEMKFEQYSEAIVSRIYAAPEVKLSVEAALEGDEIQISFNADKEIAGAGYYMALVQDEARYAGSNGIVFHKMVVREFMTVDPKSQNVKLLISKAEEAGALHITQFEKERGPTFPEKFHKIDKTQLHVVFFAQNPQTKAVYNAAVCRVE
jgi:hypothetical protein